MKKRLTRGTGLCEGILAKLRFNMADNLIKSNQRNGRILDIGCSSRPHFLIQTNFAHKYGIDKLINEECINQLHKTDIHLINLDIETSKKLPFEDAFFEVITMLAIFEHIQPDKLNTLLNEINRILKPGGCLIITTPAFWTENLQKILSRLGLISKEELNEHKDIYSHAKMTPYLVSSGFKKSGIRCGFFELFMNSWTFAEKD